MRRKKLKQWWLGGILWIAIMSSCLWETPIEQKKQAVSSAAQEKKDKKPLPMQAQLRISAAKQAREQRHQQYIKSRKAQHDANRVRLQRFNAHLKRQAMTFGREIRRKQTLR